MKLISNVRCRKCNGPIVVSQDNYIACLLCGKEYGQTKRQRPNEKEYLSEQKQQAYLEKKTSAGYKPAS